ncbi:isoleucine--tRNA ligase [Candidatus Sneabacter namystus]|uniref:isoleucine--tRNA ligase n=1 Tax=Candidatus Sneabacter namystus TaxID=2601646 RepID=UPI00155AAB50|nr:isoleucine--tRNA ligase [Candidatus Sneabacter namystus]
MSLRYPKTIPNPHFPKIEENILEYWHTEKIFEKSVNQRKTTDKFVFYDGPPFANGLPHYGHLLTGFVKDTYARFHTSLNKRVERRFGWDCHGLPAEMGAEKDLKLSGSLDIKEYGIEKFNSYCKDSVLKYTQAWQKYVTRQGRWVDFENDYKTMNLTFMESVLWVFKKLYDKGLIYHDTKVVPYSWACQTPLSNFETKLDNSYREKKDKAVTVTFELLDLPESVKKIDNVDKCFLLSWTTTPWTLPSNLALAVGDTLTYSVVLKGTHCYILSCDSLSKYKNELNAQDVVATITAKELEGKSYKPIFTYFESNPNSFKVLVDEFVSKEAGTGVVHIAPAFGEDDHNLCKKYDIKPVCPVDEGGVFTKEVSDFSGMQVFAATDSIIMELKKKQVWFKTEQYIHRYPHCWRTDEPLIYKSVPSWYVKVSSFRDKMVNLNEQINWIPTFVKNNLFGKWLENAKDWAISRHRFWGAPVPVWVSDNPKYPRIDVYGSIKDLEKDFNVKVKDLHRPFIDSLVRTNPDDPSGQSMMRRVPDVLDCWFESGAMPYAEAHYPFENKENFINNFPADFIAEYTAQTRGWFYTLMVLSTALFDKPPFLNCVCHGVVLDAKGQKLSKRLNNYPDPLEIFDQYGADALRVTMLSSNVVKGGDLLLDKEGKAVYDSLRLTIKPIWQAYHFFCMYSNSDNITAKIIYESDNVLDKYILSQLRITTDAIKVALKDFNSQNAYQEIDSFFDKLNNWYIRRSRQRFWKHDICEDKLAAYNALFTCLITMSQACASLLPMLCEEIYLGLSRKTLKESVHLELFPLLNAIAPDLSLLTSMEKVRAICKGALFIRNKTGIRVRQTLKDITIYAINTDALEQYIDLIKEEIGVQEVVFRKDVDTVGHYILVPNLDKIAARIPSKVQQIISAVRKEDWQHSGDNSVIVSGELLSSDEFSLVLSVKDKEAKNVKAIPEIECIISLNTNLDSSLVEKGWLNDLIRLIQEKRKLDNYHISEKVRVEIFSGNERSCNVIQSNIQIIEEQTLSKVQQIQQIPQNSDICSFEEFLVHFRICSI